MREIKFRVWVEGFKEPFYAPQNDWSVSFHDTGHRLIMWCSDGIVDEFPIETVEQYTGLKDKNGVEIYEGDTVVIHGYTDRGDGSPDPYIGNVSWENGAFQINGADLLYHLEGVDEFEVIGNIHTEGAG